MTKIVAHLVLGLLFLCANAVAGPYDDGVAAYDQGQYAAALKWWLPLAEQGHAAAQFNVAVLYEKGLGTAVDHAEAARWYLKAAQQGDPDAQYNVALFYETGTGVAKDVDQARNWYAEVLANRRAKADSPVRQRATAHLKALSTQEVIAFDEGRFVIANADAQTCVVALQGKITHDASVTFDDVIRRTERAGCADRWLVLESPGGTVVDALALAKDVRSGRFRTVTRYDCASACSLIFTAGIERVLVGSRARIGFHEAATIDKSNERHCSDGFDLLIRRHLMWVIPEHADDVMRVVRSTSCRTIEWIAGQRALDLAVATRLDAGDVDVFGARSSRK